MSFTLGLISLGAFLLSIIILIGIWFSYRKLPLVGLNIVRGTATNTAVSTAYMGVRGNGFRGFLKLMTTLSFWKELIKSLFTNTKDEVILTFKKAFFSLISSVILFIGSLITGFIQILIWIF